MGISLLLALQYLTPSPEKQQRIKHVHIAHLRQECHNSKFGIFELLVLKETFADALLTGIVS
jgi:hypothetical protein